MRKKLSMGLLCCMLSIFSFAQKKIIDSQVYEKWGSLRSYDISADGKYVWYKWASSLDYETVLISTSGKYNLKIPHASEPSFVENGSFFAYRVPGDSLCLMNLKTKKLEFFRNVLHYKFITSDVLLYSTPNQIYLRNLVSSRLILVSGVQDYVLSPDRSKIVLIKKTESAFEEIVLKNFSRKKIQASGRISNLTYNCQGTAFSFFCTDSSGKNRLYCYENTIDRIKLLVDSSSLNRYESISENLINFSQDGKYLFFKIRNEKKPVNDKDMITDQVIVWNYKDEFLPGEYGNYQHKNSKEIISVVKLANREIIRLEDDSTECVLPYFGCFSKNGYVLLRSIKSFSKALMDVNKLPVYHLFNIDNRNREAFIPKGHRPVNSSVEFSPSGRFVFWSDYGTKDIWTYDVIGRRIMNNTRSIGLADSKNFSDGMPPIKVNHTMIWLPGDTAYLATDEYDIWQINPLNNIPPINLTKNYGRKNNIRFQIESFLDGNLTLRFMDSKRNNGLGVLSFQKNSQLKLGKPSACLYSWGLVGGPLSSIKAKRADMYVVSKQTATESANVYATPDFKNYLKLSDICPEREFNWMNSELITWKMYDGQQGTGILYKPENFDPAKRYPLIFNYYQGRSDELNQYHIPEIEGNSISIPEYVSSGYIVFVPDILNPKKGNSVGTVLNSVESAAKYLVSKYSWLDEKRLGIEGHSFGGYETNLLIANSTIFAAACSSAGIANLTSWRGQTGWGERSLDWQIQTGQINMGQNTYPWNVTSLFIRNSPVYNADKVTTPTLLLHGTRDGAVTFGQAQEWFTALRNAGKRVWLVEYKMMDHVFGHSKEGQDAARRQRQFFDHYLMDKPAPVWMTEGINAKEQPFKSGFSIDSIETKP